MPLAESGDEQAGVLVQWEGFQRVIAISEKRVKACIDADGLEETQRYAGELADRIRAAVRETSA